MTEAMNLLTLRQSRRPCQTKEVEAEAKVLTESELMQVLDAGCLCAALS